MASTGNEEFDNHFQYPASISCIYGGPGTGKTTLCLLAAAKEKGKVIFIDTENGFSAERMIQINKKLPENIFLISAKDFKDQCKAVDSLLSLKKTASLIIIDSFTAYYRKGLQEKIDINSRMSKQFSILSEMAREGIPVIITSQVYMRQDSSIEPVGSNMLKNWCGCLLKLEKDKERKITVEKHPENKRIEKNFEINNEGIKLL